MGLMGQNGYKGVSKLGHYYHLKIVRNRKQNINSGVLGNAGFEMQNVKLSLRDMQKLGLTLRCERNIVYNQCVCFFIAGKTQIKFNFIC